MDYDREEADALLWLRITVVVCLFIAAQSVMDSFIFLFSYWAYLGDQVNPTRHPEWYKALEEIRQSPYSFLALNLYNIVLWNGVIISSIWVLRYYAWSRRILTALLGFDMIVTVIMLLWECATGTLRITSAGWFILFNALQVLAIIALSHPRIIGLTETLSTRRKQAIHQLDKSDLC